MENEIEKKRKTDWQPLIELIIVLATVVGTTVPLYIHTDNKMEEHRKETKEYLDIWRQELRDRNEQWHAEMKEIHGRLCMIEEKNKGK